MNWRTTLAGQCRKIIWRRRIKCRIKRKRLNTYERITYTLAENAERFFINSNPGKAKWN